MTVTTQKLAVKQEPKKVWNKSSRDYNVVFTVVTVTQRRLQFKKGDILNEKELEKLYRTDRWLITIK